VPIFAHRIGLTRERKGKVRSSAAADAARDSAARAARDSGAARRSVFSSEVNFFLAIEKSLPHIEQDSGRNAFSR
jgi:hypothetical protein